MPCLRSHLSARGRASRSDEIQRNRGLVPQRIASANVRPLAPDQRDSMTAAALRMSPEQPFAQGIDRSEFSLTGGPGWPAKVKCQALMRQLDWLRPRKLFEKRRKPFKRQAG